MLDVAGVDAELLTSGITYDQRLRCEESHADRYHERQRRGARRRRCGIRRVIHCRRKPEFAERDAKEPPIAAGETIAVTIKTVKAKSAQAKFLK